MADFSHLKKLHVTDETLAEYVFEDIDGEPSIWLAPATEGNAAFLNESLRLSAEETERVMKIAEATGNYDAPPETVDTREAARDKDRRLIANFCAKKWGNPPLDVNGDAPEFTADNCYDFFCALPSDMFDPVRNFVVNVRRFRKAAGITKAAADALGNGSPKG